MKSLLKPLLMTGIIFGSVTSFAATTSLPTYNATSLKTYNGQKGHKTYVALNGYVYDVSKVPQWQGGKHYMGMVAGTDLTPHIDDSPHGPTIVKQLKLQPVGIYK